MPGINIGIRLASLGQPVKKALQTAAKLGADAVELDGRRELRPNELSGTGLRHFRKLLDDLNLRVCAINFPTRRGYNILDDLDRRIDATRQAMQMAYDLGAGVVINHVGRIPPEAEGSQWDLLLASLGELGRHGQHQGAMLAARTGAEEASLLGKLIDALPAGSLVVDLDPGGLLINGFSAVDAAGVLGPHVRHVHARDGVRDLAQGRGLEVQLGRGSADFPELVGKLEEHEYRGYYTIQREPSAAAIVEIGQAVQFLRAL